MGIAYQRGVLVWILGVLEHPPEFLCESGGPICCSLFSECLNAFASIIICVEAESTRELVSSEGTNSSWIFVGMCCLVVDV